MTATEIIQRLFRRVGLLILLTLLGGVAGAWYATVRTPTYTAKAYVVAVSQGGDSIGALNFAQAYGRVATSGAVLAKATIRLRGDGSGLANVTASTSPDAPVVEIVATGPSAARTAEVANAVAGSLVEYGSERRTTTKVNLALLAAAVPPTRPSSPKPPLELVVGAATGLLVGGLAVLAGVGRGAWPARRGGRTTRAADSDEVEPENGFTHVHQLPSLESPAEIAGHVGVWRAKYGPKAITAYRSSVVVDQPGENSASIDAEPVSAARPEPVNAKPLNAKPVNAKPVNAKPVDAKPVDAKPVDAAPTDVRDAKPTAGQRAYDRPIVGRATVAGMDEDEDDD